MIIKTSLAGYVQLCRVSNLPTIWTNVLAAAVLAGEPSGHEFVVLFVGMSLYYAGGMCLNDIIDAADDSVTRPSRPLPSGTVSLTNASLFAWLLLLSAQLVLLLLPSSKAFLLGLVLLALIIAYNVFHAAIRESVVLMAGCRFMIFLITGVGIRDDIPGPVLVAGAVQFIYTLTISETARFEKSNGSFGFPVVPYMIAGFSLIDGLLMSCIVSPVWMFAGLLGFLLTIAGQRFVRGD